MDGLGEDFELVALGAGVLKQVGGGGLAGKEQNLDIGQQLRTRMAASMPLRPAMMTSEMSMSGLKQEPVRGLSRRSRRRGLQNRFG